MKNPEQTHDEESAPSKKRGVIERINRAFRDAFMPWRMRCLWAICVLLTFLANPYIFTEGQHPLMSGIGLAAATVMSCGIILLCIKFRWTAYVILPVIILLNLTLCLLQVRYGLSVNLSLIASVMETNMEEVASFCTPGTIINAVLVLGVLFAGLYWCRRALKPVATTGAVLLIWGLYGVIHLLALPAHSFCQEPLTVYYRSDMAKGWPVIDFMMNYQLVQEYLTYDAASYQQLKNLPSSAEKESECHAPQDLVVLFHMGESVRADHLPFNGYKRNTMPLMSAEPNLISYPHMSSFGVVTRVACIGIFTDAEMQRRSPRYSTFIDLFNKHGFQSVRIMDLNGYSINDFSLGILTGTCQRSEQTPSRKVSPDMEQERTALVFERVIEELGHQRQLYVIYNSGSHMEFVYPKKAELFTPASCNMDAPAEQLHETINAYDNSIVDMDACIHRIISRLKDRPAIYIYCGDHGVALGENGKMFQGHVLPCVYNPGMFIWYSDSFAAQHPQLVAALKNNREKRISHDHIFHTVLSAASIKSPVIKPELNLCHPQAKETPITFDPVKLDEWRFLEKSAELGSE